MNLPYVRISFQNGQLGITEPTADGICGLIPAGAVVVGTYTEKSGDAYLITSLDCVTKTGTDALTYEMIREFFAEAGEGSYLWILNYKPTTAEIGVSTLQGLSNGACRVIGVVEPLDTPATDIPLLQTAADNLASQSYAPVLVVAGIEAPTTIGNATDLTQLDANRVAVVCGNEVTGVTATDTVLAGGAAIGLLLGRIAKNSVEVSVARVADGAIKASKLAFGSADITKSDVSTLCTKGYIVPRTWVGKSGFFWCADSLATAVTDDYGLIQRRRTIDKAFRIAYKALIEEVGMQIPVTSDGTIPVSTAKSIEALVETALEKGMTNQGNLGTDPDDDTDNGVKVFVDPTQNVVSTSTLNVNVKVKPYGYAYYINCDLSFYTND